MLKAMKKRWLANILAAALICVSIGGCFSPQSSTYTKNEVKKVAAGSLYYSVSKLDSYTDDQANSIQYMKTASLDDSFAVLFNAKTPVGGEVLQYTHSDFIWMYALDGNILAKMDVSTFSGYKIAGSCITAYNNKFYVLLYNEEDADGKEFFLYSFDKTGVSLSSMIRISLPDSFDPLNLTISSSGNIFLSDHSSVECLDSNGTWIKKITAEYSLENTVIPVGDTIYFDTYDGVIHALYPFSTVDSKFYDLINLDSYQFAYDTQFYGLSEKLYVSDKVGLYQLDLVKSEKTRILSWQDMDLPLDSYSDHSFSILSENRILAIEKTFLNNSSQATLYLLKKESQNPNASKTILTVAGFGVSADTTLMQAISDFNKDNSSYRMELHDYYEDYTVDSMDSYSKAVREITLDILSGNGPDLFAGELIPFDIYLKQGLLVDLNTLIEKDTMFQKNNYLENILKLFEADGHLFEICGSFQIVGLMGRTSIVGEKSGWTIEDFRTMEANLPETVNPVVNVTQSDLLMQACQNSLPDLIDFDKGTTDFTSDDFLEALSYAKEYGVNLNSDSQNNVDEMSLYSRGAIALCKCYVNSAYDYNNNRQLSGTPISVTGYPSIKAHSAVCMPSQIVAISTLSPSQEGAWDFIKVLLSESSQKRVSAQGRIPVLASVFEQQISNAMDPTNEKMEDNLYYSMFSGIPVMDEQTADAYRSLVYGIDAISISDLEVLGIISEESPSYFSDDKSAEEVASLIQNRVSTLLQERQ